MTGLARGGGTEGIVGKVAVAKIRYKTVSPRGDATEVPEGRVAVPKSR